MLLDFVKSLRCGQKNVFNIDLTLKFAARYVFDQSYVCISLVLPPLLSIYLFAYCLGHS